MNKIITLLAVALLTIPTYLLAAQNQNLESILLEAASAGNTDMARSFLDNGANIEIKNEVGATPLIFASAKGQKEVVALLLERKANVNAKTNTGITPLMAAASGGYLEIVKLLLAKGADVSAKDQQGLTAFSMAEAAGESEVADLLKPVQKSSTPEQPRVASQDKSYNPQRSRERSDSGPADSEPSGPMPDFSQSSEGAMPGQPGGLLNDPLIGQMLSRALSGQQSGPGPVEAVQNPDMQVNVQNAPPGEAGNAPNQPPGQAGNAPNQPPGQAGNAPNQPPGQGGKVAPPDQAGWKTTLPDGPTESRITNPATGETQVTITNKDPKTGAGMELHKTLDKFGNEIPGLTEMQTHQPKADGGQIITRTKDVNGKQQATTTIETNAKNAKGGTIETHFNPNSGLKTSTNINYPSGSSTYTQFSGDCRPDGSGKGCRVVSTVERNPKTGKMTSTTYDKDGKVTGTKVTDIPKDPLQKAAMFKAKQNQANLPGAKQQNLPGNKPQDQQKNLAGDKQKNLAGNKQQVQADVLNQIQGKPGANLKTGALDPKKAGQAVQLNPQPLPPGPPPDKLIGKPKLEDKFTGVKPQFDNKFQTGGNKNLKQDFNKQAVTHGNTFKEKVIPQNQTPEGIKHKTQNMPVEQFKAKTKSQNFNQPAGGQLQKWNR